MESKDQHIGRELVRLLELLNPEELKQLKDTCKKLTVIKISDTHGTISHEERVKNENEFFWYIGDFFLNAVGEKLDIDIIYEMRCCLKFASNGYCQRNFPTLKDRLEQLLLS